MKFTALDDSTISYIPSTVSTAEYSLDTINWHSLDNEEILLESGVTMCVRGVISGNQSSANTNNAHFVINNGAIEASGNINSLINKEEDTLSLNTRQYCYAYLFSGCTDLIKSCDLPSTTLTVGCYKYMFYHCSGLTDVIQELPASSVTTSAYHGMYSNCDSLVNPSHMTNMTTIGTSGCCHMYQYCTSLIDAPELPATKATGSGGVYAYMFRGCTSLVNGPSILPFTTYGNSYIRNYVYMFQNCYSLQRAPKIMLDILQESWYYMFDGCSSLVNGPEIPGGRVRVSWESDYVFRNCTSLKYPGFDELECVDIDSHMKCTAMFSGCTSLETAPKLITTSFPTGGQVYRSMFANCTSLQEAPELPSTNMTSAMYYQMFSGCTSLTKTADMAVKFISVSGCTGMYSGCTALTQITLDEYEFDSINNAGLQSMFNGCISLERAPKIICNNNLGNNGLLQMFMNCTSLINMPEIIIKGDIGSAGLQNMFANCTSLSEVTNIVARNIGASGCYQMFSGCTALTTGPEMNVYGIGTSGCTRMFMNCTSLESVDLHAHNVTSARTYQETFSGCTNLRSIRLGAENTHTDISNTLYNWVIGVPETTDGAVEYDGFINMLLCGNHGIPYKWSHERYKNNLCITAIEDSIISYIPGASTIEYSLDCGYSWNTLDNEEIVLESGVIMELRGEIYDDLYYEEGVMDRSFNISGNVKLSGSIMSLYNYDAYDTVVSYSNVFAGLFKDCDGITDAYNLIMDFQSDIGYGCCQSMFEGCINLRRAPKMLYDVISVESSFKRMFYGCENLTEAPVILLNNFGFETFYEMFFGCSLLDKIVLRSIDGDISADAFTSWVKGVAETGTLYKYDGLDLPIDDISGVAPGWTVKTMNSTDLYDGFKILAYENSTVNFRSYKYFSTEYSLDNGNTWYKLDDEDILLEGGMEMCVRGTIVNNLGGSGTTNNGHFTFSGDVEISGNIRNLRNYYNYKTSLNTTYNAIFCNLFRDNLTLISSRNLILDSNNNTTNVYDTMFYNCQNMVDTCYELPSSACTVCCYQNMYQRCGSLVTAPIIQSHTLALGCYANMFAACTSLVNVQPVIYGKSLATQAFNTTFARCTSLQYAPDLEIEGESTASYALQYMFRDCRSLIKPPSKLLITSNISCGYYRMFSGCTSLEYSPEIYINKCTGDYCMQDMFSGCTSLKQVVLMNMTSMSAPNWLAKVSPSGVIYKPDDLTLTLNSASGVPVGWTTKSISEYEPLP